MTSHTRKTHPSWCLFAIAAFGLVGCVGDNAVSPGKGGGVKNNPGSCVIGPADNVWGPVHLSGDRTQPSKCPYKVDYQNQRIEFVANLYGPSDLVYRDGSATLGPIKSTQDGFTVLPSQPQYWSDDPAVYGGLTLQFTGGYIAAHYVGVGPWATDSGPVVVDRTNRGPATAFLTLTGTSYTSNPYVATNGGIYVQAPTTLRAVTSVDTNSYHFSWRVDGQDVPGNDDALLGYTFGLPGNHDVTAFASYQTGVETIHASVYSAMVVRINGPQSMDPDAGAGHWDAYIPGGYPPYTYQWYVDGSPGSTASYLERFFDPTTSHDISVTVRDSHGFTATDVITVITTAGGTCLQQPCY
jgi:hypothetical protein